MRKLVSLLGMVGLLYSFVAYGNGLSTSSTRLIYNSHNRVIPYSIFNTDTHTYLIQTWIEDNKNLKTRDFIVTPPLFKMYPNSENGLRIMYTGIKPLPKDRESLFWLNVKAIPGIPKDQIKSVNYLQLALKMRMKLFYRPDNLMISPEEISQKLKVIKIDDQTISIVNPTPYYVTIIKIENSDTHQLIADTSQNMLSPFSDQHIQLKANKDVKSLSLFLINDYGGINTVTLSISQK